jgi:hypothetical protein
VIEPGSEVVDNLADQDAPAGRRLEDLIDPQREAPVSLELLPGGIETSFGEPLDRLIESVQVVLGPVELEHDAG